MFAAIKFTSTNNAFTSVIIKFKKYHLRMRMARLESTIGLLYKVTSPSQHCESINGFIHYSFPFHFRGYLYAISLGVTAMTPPLLLSSDSSFMKAVATRGILVEQTQQLTNATLLSLIQIQLHV